jgi:hypothetical protein
MSSMGKGPERDRRLEQHWRRHVAAWRRSGLEIRSYCAQHRLSEGSFYAWRRELARRANERGKRPAPRSKWVAVTVIPEPTLEVALPTGVVVRAPAGAEPSAVAKLVAALRAESC